MGFAGTVTVTPLVTVKTNEDAKLVVVLARLAVEAVDTLDTDVMD